MALNILIVDDSDTVRSVLEKTLRMAQVPLGQCVHARNGAEGLEKLSGSWVDLIFADINMPVMNGVEMIEKLSADGLLKSIPVVVISTEGSATRIEELKKRGIAAFLRKPFQPMDIKNIIDTLFGAAHAG